MIKTGLSPEIIETLNCIFSKYPTLEQVKLYGSRAKGTYKVQSDIDLVAFGLQLDRYVIGDILAELEESEIPYRIDLQNYLELTNLALMDHINRVGLVIFDRRAL